MRAAEIEPIGVTFSLFYPKRAGHKSKGKNLKTRLALKPVETLTDPLFVLPMKVIMRNVF